MIEVGPNLTRILGWLLIVAVLSLLYQVNMLGTVLIVIAFLIFWLVA